MNANLFRRVLDRMMLYSFLLIAGAVFALPFIWMVSTSLKPMRELYEVTPRFIPSEFVWRNYADALAALPFARFFLNSVVMTVGRVIGQVILCSMAAFAFARLRFPGRDALFVILLGALMVPEPMTVIPNFILVKNLGWLDSYVGLIVPSLFSAFGTFLLRQFFMGVPQEIQEAAVIEGANPFRVWWHIFMPLSRSAVAAFALLVTVWSWKDFLWPLIITSKTDMQVLSVGIALFQGQYAGQTNVAHMMAAATMTMAPLVLIFLFAQRQLIEGIALSGIKG